MSNIVIHITAGEVITSTIVYGFVHGIWTGIKWGLRHLETNAGQIIDQHVKDGHHARLTSCFEGGCARLGIALKNSHQAEPSQPERQPAQ